MDDPHADVAPVRHQASLRPGSRRGRVLLDVPRALGFNICVLTRAVTCLTVVALVAVAAPAVADAKVRRLQLGAHGADVRNLQHRLSRLKYLPSHAVTGRFDMRTWHAVVAFQGWTGQPRDGVFGPKTRRALRRAKARPQPWSKQRGIEIHIDRQVLLLVAHERVQRAIHISSGTYGGTPLGRFSIQSRWRMSWSRKFKVWMPKAQYFYGGYAMHEMYSVPAFPASHGCVRLPAEESGVVWKFGKVGMRVTIGA
jgi:hypothetical protein